MKHLLDQNDGGGSLIKEYFVEAVRERIGNQKKVLELCAGEGSIGLHMLETEFCEEIHFSDFNEYALPKNSEFKTYISDGFKSIPPDQKFDLIFANPPWFCNDTFYFNEMVYSPERIVIDEKWRLHKHIFSNASDYLNDDGYLVLLDCVFANSATTFAAHWKNLELVDYFNYHNEQIEGNIMTNISYTSIYRKTNV